LISKISKILKNPLNARIPDIKVKGNLYNFFYGE